MGLREGLILEFMVSICSKLALPSSTRMCAVAASCSLPSAAIIRCAHPPTSSDWLSSCSTARAATSSFLTTSAPYSSTPWLHGAGHSSPFRSS